MLCLCFESVGTGDIEFWVGDTHGFRNRVVAKVEKVEYLIPETWVHLCVFFVIVSCVEIRLNGFYASYGVFLVVCFSLVLICVEGRGYTMRCGSRVDDHDTWCFNRFFEGVLGEVLWADTDDWVDDCEFVVSAFGDCVECFFGFWCDNDGVFSVGVQVFESGVVVYVSTLSTYFRHFFGW